MRMLLLSRMAFRFNKLQFYIFKDSQRKRGGGSKARGEGACWTYALGNVDLHSQIWSDIIDQLMGGKLYQSKRKYCKISYKKRLTLIQMVQEQKIGVTRAAKKLKIKVPTAKVILSSFRRKGTIFKKRVEGQKAVESPSLEAKQETPLVQNNEEIGYESSGMMYYPVVWMYGVGIEGVINFLI